MVKKADLREHGDCNSTIIILAKLAKTLRVGVEQFVRSWRNTKPECTSRQHIRQEVSFHQINRASAARAMSRPVQSTAWFLPGQAVRGLVVLRHLGVEVS